MANSVWLLTTRERPQLAQDCLDACEATGMTAAGVVYVDGDVDAYDGLRLPANWTLHLEPERLGLSRALRWFYEGHPEARSYGWLADDVIPHTEGWDRALEALSGSWGLSYACDDWFSAQEGGPDTLVAGEVLSTALCWGGELVRAVGWLALPGTFQGATDVAWARVASRFHLTRYCPTVRVEHRHWRAGKREQDALDTDQLDENGHRHTADDIRLLWAWLGGDDFEATCRRVALRRGVVDGVERTFPDLAREALVALLEPGAVDGDLRERLLVELRR